MEASCKRNSLVGAHEYPFLINRVLTAMFNDLSADGGSNVVYMYVK